MNKVIEAKELIKNYDTNGIIVPVINGISMEVMEGEFLAITGISGSGKSTLLYLLSGIETPCSGEIYIEGKELSKLKEKEIARMRRQDISFVYQFYNLIPNLTIIENIVLSKRIDCKLEDEDKIYLEELINLAGISHIRNRKPSEVSGGEQQRVALIRAVFTKPKVIFLDEPTGNLDSKSSKMVMDLIMNINKTYKTTLIMVTHSLEQAKQADRIITLRDGVIIQDN